MGILAPGGNSSVANKKFCECECNLPILTLMFSRRVNDSPPSDSQDNYTFAKTNISGKSYSAFSSVGHGLGQKIASFTTGSGTITQTPPTGRPYTTTEVNKFNRSSAPILSTAPPGYTPPPPYVPHDLQGVSLQDGKYKWRITWPVAWPFNNTQFRVVWRERTANYAGTQTKVSHVPETTRTEDWDETAPLPSYVKKTALVTINKGSTYAETDVFEVTAISLTCGDTVSICGPSEIGKYAITGSISLSVYPVGESAYKNGFPPYQIAEGTSGHVPCYAVETATAAPGALHPYSGSQTVKVESRIIDDDSPFTHSMITNSIRPGGVVYSGSVMDYTTEADVLSAKKLSPTVTTYEGGLILTLSSEIPDSLLTAFVDSRVANIVINPSNYALSDVSGVLALRYLPASGLYYQARKSKVRTLLSFDVDEGTFSRNPAYGNTDSEYYLCPPVGNVSGTIKKVTTNLDTNTSADSDINVNFDFDFSSDVENADTLPGDGGGTYLSGATYTQYGAFQDIATPGSNSKITIGDAKITTDTLDCWYVNPLIELVE